jgi:hypothetical protein
MIFNKIARGGYLLFSLIIVIAVSNTIFAISVSSAIITSVAGVDVQDILKKIGIRLQEVQKSVNDVTFLAKTTYREIGKDGNYKKEVLVQKRVFMKNDDKHHEEYISMVINGKNLNKKEMDKESKEWQKNNSKSTTTKSPLSEESRNDYSFKLLGSSNIMNLPVWVIEFKSKKEEENYINGKAYILKATYDIVRVDFVPAKLSSVVKNIDMSLIYSDIQGYWMPVKFEMAAKVNVKFILNMYYKEIKLEDVYYQHKLNTGLQDSLFRS